MPAVDAPSDSLFGPLADEETPAALAAALAPPAAPGHFDELRGAATPSTAPSPATKTVAARAMPARVWGRFFEHLGREGFSDLNRRTLNVARQVRDNGITYNVYADADGPQRPWSLDLFPLIVDAQAWKGIEVGVLQRVQLLERVLADVYGPQRLIAQNLLPPALVQGHPGYLRPMHGIVPPGGTHLHIAAFDIVRDPQGQWWVVTQRTQAPSGLGYLLENRLIISRQFPEAFRDLKVQRLAATYRALLDSLTAMCPREEGEPRIVLLTPGPYNETYFEHAYLARYLGITLVEGSDLTVRQERVYLKTLRGLERVHGILKRLDDEFLDPLELRPDSRLGVPGLLQSIRAGHVLVANAPGSGFLESCALLGFLPALSRHLLGEELKMPSLATWWCGERAALEAVLPDLATSVIKSTYTGPGSGAVLGKHLSQREVDEWAGRILRAPEDYTVQAYMPLSQMPAWKSDRRGDRMVPRSLMLRVFAVSDGRGSWRVLPGGLTRLAGTDLEIASMQRGGSSADTWVLTEGEVDTTSLLVNEHPAGHRVRAVTSRASENLFWLGRYTERTENTARLARLALESLNGEDQSSQPLLHWLDEMARANALVLPAVPPAAQSRRVFERSLVASLADTTNATSVGFNLGALRHAASAVRERLSQEQWNLIVQAGAEFQSACAPLAAQGEYSSAEAVRVLQVLSGHTAAMTGAQTDRMTRDDGWRLLSSGRHLERLGFLAQALLCAFETGAVHDESGFEALVALFDSTITFHAQYQQRHDIAALLDLLVIDRDNPRSLGWVAQTLRGRLAKLAANTHHEDDAQAMNALLPDPEQWSLDALCARDAEGQHAALVALLRQCIEAAYRLSDLLSDHLRLRAAGEDGRAPGAPQAGERRAPAAAVAHHAGGPGAGAAERIGRRVRQHPRLLLPAGAARAADRGGRQRGAHQRGRGARVRAHLGRSARAHALPPRRALRLGGGVRLCFALCAAPSAVRRIRQAQLHAGPPAAGGGARADAPHPRRLRVRDRGHGRGHTRAAGAGAAPGRVPGLRPRDARLPAQPGLAGALRQRLPADRAAARPGAAGGRRCVACLGVALCAGRPGHARQRGPVGRTRPHQRPRARRGLRDAGRGPRLLRHFTGARRDPRGRQPHAARGGDGGAGGTRAGRLGGALPSSRRSQLALHTGPAPAGASPRGSSSGPAIVAPAASTNVRAALLAADTSALSNWIFNVAGAVTVRPAARVSTLPVTTTCPAAANDQPPSCTKRLQPAANSTCSGRSVSVATSPGSTAAPAAGRLLKLKTPWSGPVPVPPVPGPQAASRSSRKPAHSVRTARSSRVVVVIGGMEVDAEARAVHALGGWGMAAVVVVARLGLAHHGAHRLAPHARGGGMQVLRRFGGDLVDEHRLLEVVVAAVGVERGGGGMVVQVLAHQLQRLLEVAARHEAGREQLHQRIGVLRDAQALQLGQQRAGADVAAGGGGQRVEAGRLAIARQRQRQAVGVQVGGVAQPARHQLAGQALGRVVRHRRLGRQGGQLAHVAPVHAGQQAHGAVRLLLAGAGQLVARGLEEHALERRRKRRVGHAMPQQEAGKRPEGVQDGGQGEGGTGLRQGGRMVADEIDGLIFVEYYPTNKN
jgi:uncharacterized circularly permuted ATP-grasp superfamily protein/uncharacterized alpha-E superfamily protein